MPTMQFLKALLDLTELTVHGRLRLGGLPYAFVILNAIESCL